MDENRLAQLNEMAKKIDWVKAVMNSLKNLQNKKVVVVTDFNNGRVMIPDTLSDVIFTLLKDYYQKKLDSLEKEFEES